MGLRMAELSPKTGPHGSSNQSTEHRLWLAAYTRSQHEVKVARHLQSKAIAFLLPTYTRTSQWSDRLRKSEAPLFPGYVFVNVSEEERVRVLQTIGVVNFVSASGHPSSLSESDVALLKECVARPEKFQPHEFLHIGQRVRVRCGPFAGLEGVLTGKKNSSRLVVTLEQIMRSVAVDLDGATVEAVH